MILKSKFVMNWNSAVLENARYLDALAQAYYRSRKLGPAKARYEKIAPTGPCRDIVNNGVDKSK